MTVYRRGEVWYYSFQLDGRRHVKRVGPHHEAATHAEQIARAKALQARYHDEWGLASTGRSSITLRQFIAQVFEASVLSGLTTRSSTVNAKSLSRVVAARVGTLKVARLTRGDIERYRGRRLMEVSPNQVRTELRWLRRITTAARRQGLLARDPFQGVSLPAPRAYPDRVLRAQEDDRLLRHAPTPTVRSMLVLALYTGLRRQEIVGLRRREVDPAAREIVMTQPKTGTVKRVPLAQPALEALRPFLRGEPDAPVFLNQRGRPFAVTTFWDAFRKARTAARLQDVKLHHLRHTVAVRMLRNGADPPTVGDILGHRPPYKQTYRYLAHVDPGRKRAAVESLTRQNPQRQSRKR